MTNDISFTRGSGLLEKFLSEQRAKKANSIIPQSFRKGNILDIGCGSYPYFLTTTTFANKFGIDPAVSTTEVEGVNLQKINIAKEKLPFKDNFFDVVTMLAVFEHIEKDRLNFLLNEINRVLKKGGMLIITTPAPWSDKLLHQMAKFGLISSEEIHDHKSHYSQAKIVDMISESNFNKDKIKGGFFEVFLNMWFVAEK
jgi:ubiquinone/menaquinone biosynthesis C-methylase UbiE